jgi:hypothetical protein
LRARAKGQSADSIAYFLEGCGACVDVLRDVMMLLFLTVCLSCLRSCLLSSFLT